MSIPAKFAQTYDELVKSLRREVKDNLKMSNLKKPIAMTLGERYALIAEIEKNICDCIVAMWKLEHKHKPLRNCDVGTADEQTQRFDQFCHKHKTMEKCCGDCPALGLADCEFVWSQMPYEKGRAK